MAAEEDRKRLTVVTSFSPRGYEEYGRDFVASFRKYWNVDLAVYLEAPVQTYPGLGEVILPARLDDEEDMPEWQHFYSGINRFALMRGETPQGYNIQYDARMARKAFIQADAVKMFGGKVFWVDADVVTHSKVPDGFLDEVLPDDKLCCYLGRDWMYTESGFLGFNANHQYCEAFMKGYLRIFQQGYIFTQQAWHDCIAFDLARRQLPRDYFHDLASWLPHGTMHPFVNSILGAYMDHRKGPRKSSRSGASDLVVKRSEAYWNNGA